MALAPDERTAYLQLSFLHGFVEFDLEHDRPLRVARLPVSAKARALPREAYPLDSAHHGIAMNPEGTKLCVAGTVSDYAAIVARDDFSAQLLDVGRRPYWATNSGDGRYCFVSASGDDRVAVISYADERLVRTIQRARAGRWHTLRVVRRAATAGAARVRLGRLRLAGRHRLAITATDDAGNRSPRTVVRFRVGAKMR